MNILNLGDNMPENQPLDNATMESNEDESPYSTLLVSMETKRRVNIVKYTKGLPNINAVIELLLDQYEGDKDVN